MSANEARKCLSQTLDRICDEHVPVIITRQKGQPVVMISLEDFSAIEQILSVGRNIGLCR